MLLHVDKEQNKDWLKMYKKSKSLLKNEGDMKIWISDSEKKLPIRIQIKMKFGSMNLDLISIN